MSKPLIIEKVYNAPVATVWKAITDRNEMKQWYFDLADFKAETGFEFQFYGEGKEGQKYLHHCKVTEVIEGRKLAYSWRYENIPGNSLVSFELFSDGDQTRLILTHAGLETFPQNKPDFAKESFEGGWTYLTGTSLKEFLDKKVGGN